ncbi:hypothetical protein E3N88_32850 [Mikania micrantha]|uniref:Uncharacterized protein n=1 Tax=Mikania micrantha TaxID=192012 RepID=A0A5N6M9Q9_9ASTR|nr:hypothetical protein E3N88_32850 [Mikania micrantha]
MKIKEVDFTVQLLGSVMEIMDAIMEIKRKATCCWLLQAGRKGAAAWVTKKSRRAGVLTSQGFEALSL